MTETRHPDVAAKTARLRIWRGTGPADGHYDEFDVAFEEGDSVLDALVRLRYGPAPSLAFQFSCFNANVCKECVMMIDGAVDYACIVKLKTGLTQLDPMPDQPVLRDLLVDTRERDDKGASLRHKMLSLSDRRRQLMRPAPQRESR